MTTAVPDFQTQKLSAVEEISKQIRSGNTNFHLLLNLASERRNKIATSLNEPEASLYGSFRSSEGPIFARPIAEFTSEKFETAKDGLKNLFTEAIQDLLEQDGTVDMVLQKGSTIPYERADGQFFWNIYVIDMKHMRNLLSDKKHPYLRNFKEILWQLHHINEKKNFSEEAFAEWMKSVPANSPPLAASFMFLRVGKDEIPLTICGALLEADLSFKKSSTPICVHTEQGKIDPSLTYMAIAWSEASNNAIKKVGEETKKWLAFFSYVFAHAMPFCKGNAAMLEMLVEGFVLAYYNKRINVASIEQRALGSFCDTYVDWFFDDLLKDCP